MEEKFQQWNQNFHCLFEIIDEGFFEFTCVTNKHLTSGCLIFESRNFDAKILLQIELNFLNRKSKSA